MRPFVIAAASLFVCSPAYTQVALNSPPQQDSEQQDSRTAPPQVQGGSQSTSPQAQAQQTTIEIAEKIRSNLEQSGFKNIEMIPTTFIVRADDQNDNPVVMVVNPGSITTVGPAKETQSHNDHSDDHNTVGQGAGGSSKDSARPGR